MRGSGTRAVRGGDGRIRTPGERAARWWARSRAERSRAPPVLRLDNGTGLGPRGAGRVVDNGHADRTLFACPRLLCPWAGSRLLSMGRHKCWCTRVVGLLRRVISVRFRHWHGVCSYRKTEGMHAGARFRPNSGVCLVQWRPRSCKPVDHCLELCPLDRHGERNDWRALPLGA